MPIASYPSPPTASPTEPVLSSGHYFCSIGQDDDKRSLFAVTPGITAREAAQTLCELLDAVSEPIYATAMSERTFSSRDAWLAKYTLDAARALAGAIAACLDPVAPTS